MRITPTLVVVAFVSAASAVSAAMNGAECTAAFQHGDSNNDGSLSEAEGPSYFAALRATNTQAAAGGLSLSSFMQYCLAGNFELLSHTPEAGAPFEGANSFTETQARDRAMAAGLSNISALTKDDKGIWRGTATRGNQNVNIAVDYKGNVVSNE